MGIRDPKQIYTAPELAPGKNIIFAATGVTDGNMLHGVKVQSGVITTQTIVMRSHTGTVRWVTNKRLVR